MAITAAAVKELRELTGAGMMDCKKALVETDGDIQKAIDYLREKGLSQAQKKGGRIAAEGVVASFVCPANKLGAIVEINCETDFVAKTPEFSGFVAEVAKVAADKNPADVDALAAAEMEDGTVNDKIIAQIAKIGENIKLRRFARSFLADGENGLVECYIHMGGKIGTMIKLVGEKAETFANEDVKAFAKDMTMQIAAANPSFIRREDVDSASLEREKEVLRAQALNEGKPEKIVDRMVEGRINKYYQVNCLIEQEFVKDTDKTVKQLIDELNKKTGDTIVVAEMFRFAMGEGLEKRQDNFAEEVMSQMK